MIELYEGEHMLVAGPPRSGKSSLLPAIAESLTIHQPDTAVRTICGRCQWRSAWLEGMCASLGNSRSYRRQPTGIASPPMYKEDQSHLT